MRKLVYVACPITLGNREENFMQAAATQRFLMRAGFAVINPALTMLLPGAWDIPHETWMENSIPQVAMAHCILRLPGESKGADLEVQFAKECGKIVYDDAEKLVEFERGNNGQKP